MSVVSTTTLDICAASGAGVEGDATTAAPPLEFGDSDLDIGAASGAGMESDNPSILEQWRCHPNYPVGLRVAQISTFWTVNGLPAERFPKFLSWLGAAHPGVVGNASHSFQLLDEFACTMGRTLKECVCGALHTIVPAMGLPSNLSREMQRRQKQTQPRPVKT